MGLLVALAGPPALAAVSPPFAGGSQGLGLQVLLQLAFCGLAVAVLVIVVRFERLPLESIGLRRPGWSTLWTALLLFASGLVFQVLIGPLVEMWGRQGADAGIAELAAWPIWFRVAAGVTGGAVEEILYRGYLIERLVAITGSRWMGATTAILAFAAAHIPTWGVGFAMTADLGAGILLALFYLWRRDLAANMLAHSTGLVVAMFTVVPR